MKALQPSLLPGAVPDASQPIVLKRYKMFELELIDDCRADDGFSCMS